MAMNLDENDHTKTVQGIVLAFCIILMGGYIKDHPEDFRGNPDVFAYGKHNQSGSVFWYLIQMILKKVPSEPEGIYKQWTRFWKFTCKWYVLAI